MRTDTQRSFRAKVLYIYLNLVKIDVSTNVNRTLQHQVPCESIHRILHIYFEKRITDRQTQITKPQAQIATFRSKRAKKQTSFSSGASLLGRHK